jgi:MOSC domain-containing protein YiiM
MNESRKYNKKSFGRVFQINISAGGVPKKSVDDCRVTSNGIVRDSQNNKKDHGGSERALCLYSLELLHKLESEGHPVFPGALGENLTITGIDWNLVLPGTRIRIGENVLIQVTSFTTPCKALEKYFYKEEIERISDNTHQGWARVYAQVLLAGVINIGDVVLIE